MLERIHRRGPWAVDDERDPDAGLGSKLGSTALDRGFRDWIEREHARVQREVVEPVGRRDRYRWRRCRYVAAPRALANPIAYTATYRMGDGVATSPPSQDDPDPARQGPDGPGPEADRITNRRE